MSDLRDFFENLLFRSLGSERFIQDSPIFPEVWLEFALHPSDRQDLLLTPTPPGSAQGLATQLRRLLAAGRPEGRPPGKAMIAANMTTVAARLTLQEVFCYLVPMTRWWAEYLDHGGREELNWALDEPAAFASALERALTPASYPDGQQAVSPILVWLTHVAGTILIAETEQEAVEEGGVSETLAQIGPLTESDNPEVRSLARIVQRLASSERHPEDEEGHRLERLKKLAKDKRLLVRSVVDLVFGIQLPADEEPQLVEVVTRNRSTDATLYRSGKATKSDAVHKVFGTRGRGIRWAVIDSGIDARHVAFRRRHPDGTAYGKPQASTKPGKLLRKDLETPDEPGSYGSWAFCKVEGAFGDGWINQTRVLATYDFTCIRELLSLTSDKEIPRELRLRAISNRKRRKQSRRGLAGDLRRALKFGALIDWAKLEDLLQIPHNNDYKPPKHHHGTHVAGIIGADWRAGEHRLSPAGDRTGIAPDVEFYDLRALDENGGGDEFSLMAAMQFVRYLNLRVTGQDQMEVHGANLSFAIKHDVANFACGSTPACDEANRLVGSGVVVAAAAGNRGRARYRDVQGKVDEGYRSISITDPGNADSVITVGATHNRDPHTFGVSYFSSRGPTGDGRFKPDLVAPGESIYSTVPGNGEANTDGTSQAAPHVSGAAALLLERNPELIGDPARVKQVLCDSATDLGRERYFQGHGMLDILRAMQAV